MLGLCRGYIGMMEKKTETPIKFGIYRRYIRIAENRLAIFCWHQAPYSQPFTWKLKETPHGDSTVSQILFWLRSVKAFRTTTFRQHTRGHLILASDSVSVSSYPRESACIIILVNQDLHVNKHYTREATVHPDNLATLW